jgi:hypothetical protein
LSVYGPSEMRAAAAMDASAAHDRERLALAHNARELGRLLTAQLNRIATTKPWQRREQKELNDEIAEWAALATNYERGAA